MELQLEPAHYIWCKNLDDFIQPHLEAFERDDWRVMDAADDYHNGSCEIFTVGPNKYVDDDDAENFSRWLMGGSYYDEYVYNWTGDELPSPRAMVQWLFEQGKVPAGKYVVEIWW